MATEADRLARTTTAMKAALAGYLLAPELAEERVRNMAQALETIEAADGPRALVADMLWPLHRSIRQFHAAVDATLRAWVLAQEDSLTERLSLLADIGVPYNNASLLLQQLGLWGL